MNRHPEKLLVHSLFVLILWPLLHLSAQAGTFSFSDITQTTQTPGDPDGLFGPADDSQPNILRFAGPSQFSATSEAPGRPSDVTDSFLGFSASADDDMTWATGVRLDEFGSWLLAPGTVPEHSAGVRVNGFITITEIDGSAVSGPTITFDFSDITHEGDGVAPDSGTWQSGNNVDFASVTGQVTGFDVALNNGLFAVSDQGVSFIDKKRVEITVLTEMVPEPTSLLLGIVAFCAMGMASRQVRRSTTHR